MMIGTAAADKRQCAAFGTLFMLGLLLIFYSIPWTALRNSQPTNYDIQTLHLTPSIATCSPAPPTPPPPSPYDETKVAFLVETRPLPHLPALFIHMANVIPPEWTFRFMGSQVAIDFLRSAKPIQRLEASGKLHILALPSNYSVINRESISQMFTDPHLYQDILAPAEHLLVFQPDSIFCTNAPTSLNDFLEWDWIGAPWYADISYGGNGGLSLRKVSKILKVLGNERRATGDQQLEDLWLSWRIMLLEGSTIPHANMSKTFSVESVWYNEPLGYHIGWLGVHHEQIWDDASQVEHIMNYCPEVKMILGMKLDNDKPSGVTR